MQNNCSIIKLYYRVLIIYDASQVKSGAIYDAPQVRSGAIYDALQVRSGAICDAANSRRAAIFHVYKSYFLLKNQFH